MGTRVTAWGYVYQVGTENVPIGSDVTFSNNGPLNNITHAPGTADIGITITGTYNIAFSVYTTNNNPQDWALLVNGITPLPLVTSEFNSAGQSITGNIKCFLNAGDILTLRNINTAPVAPATGATLRTTNTISCWVSIDLLGTAQV